jgi:hypothetical protein
MFHLTNDTPFATQMCIFPNRQGIDTLFVIVKATYSLMDKMSVAENQQPILRDDVYWGEPGQSSLKYPADVHPEKPGTDVIVVGETTAPDGQPMLQLQVSISIAGRVCHLAVFGDRQWDKGLMYTKPGQPKPFTRMPLVYERAFGGGCEIEGKNKRLAYEEKNPVGKGFIDKQSRKDPANLALPNIEDVKNLIRTLQDRPVPKGFGAIAPGWQPRASFAGTFDETWRKTRAPYLPEDFDPRFYHAANPDLIFAEYLKGGEPVILVNMSPKGRLSFTLPQDEPKIEVDVTGRFEIVKAHLETVLIEPTDERLCLTWKATLSTGKKITGAKAEVRLQAQLVNSEW